MATSLGTNAVILLRVHCIMQFFAFSMIKANHTIHVIMTVLYSYIFNVNKYHICLILGKDIHITVVLLKIGVVNKCYFCVDVFVYTVQTLNKSHPLN